MKRILLSLIMLLSFVVPAICAQALVWSWERTVHPESATMRSMATDYSGNVYVGGYFGDASVIFGTDTLINTALNLHSLFVVKYSSAGNVIWAKTINGTFDDSGADFLHCDPNGNLYMTGEFSGMIILGVDTLHGTSTSGGGFIAKYDPSGSILWAKSVGANGVATANAVCTDNADGVYLTGGFSTTNITFGNTTLHNPYIGNGTTPSFVAKYRSDGMVVWALAPSAYQANSHGVGIATDIEHNVYAAGYYSGDVFIFSGDSLVNPNSSAAASFYISKIDSSGHVLWLRGPGGSRTSTSAISAIISDSIGDLHITGSFSGQVTLGGDTINGGQQPAMFLAKYNSLGNSLWTQIAHGGRPSDASSGTSIVKDIMSNIYVAGTFQGQRIVLGGDTIGDDPFGLGYLSDVFLAKYDASGNYQWAKRTTDMRIASTAGLVTNILGDIYIAGNYSQQSIAFDADTFVATSGSSGLFLAKLGTTLLPTGISDIQYSDVKIYPNPSIGIFTFIGLPEGARVQITDVMGRNILIESSKEDKYQIDLSAVSRGVYAYRITARDAPIAQGKLVINK